MTLGKFPRERFQRKEGICHQESGLGGFDALIEDVLGGWTRRTAGHPTKTKHSEEEETGKVDINLGN